VDPELRPSRKVFVVHGRNKAARSAMFSFLRALDLRPIEWSEARAMTGEASPVIGTILDVALREARAIVILLTPDDIAYLHSDYANGASDPDLRPQGQARPNVLFEAGMAMGRDPDRTVLVELGQLRPFSDIAGRYVLRIDDSPEWRLDLAQRLRDAGCEVNLSGRDWMNAGDFVIPRPDVGSGTARKPGSHRLAAASSRQDSHAAEGAGKAEADVSRVARAVEIVDAIADARQQVEAKAEIARAISDADPELARRLLAGAESSVHGIRDPAGQAQAIQSIARAMAGLDGADAVHIARTISVPETELESLIGIAEEISGQDPAGASRLLAEVRQRTGNLGKERQVAVLKKVAIALIKTSPAEAESVALGIQCSTGWTRRETGDFARFSIARSMVRDYPEKAERIIKSLPSDSGVQNVQNIKRYVAEIMLDIASWANAHGADFVRLIAAAQAAAEWADRADRDQILRRSARLMARRDVAQAQDIAHSIADRKEEALALGEIAEEIADRDPVSAEQLAKTVFDRQTRAMALCSIAKAAYESDPDGAIRMLDQAERIARQVAEPRHLAETLASIGEVVAEVDPANAPRLFGEAERVALSLTAGTERDTMLHEVAVRVAVRDSTEAARLAHLIDDPEQQVHALLEISRIMNEYDRLASGRLAGGAEEVAKRITPKADREKSMLAIVMALLRETD